MNKCECEREQRMQLEDWIGMISFLLIVLVSGFMGYDVIQATFASEVQHMIRTGFYLTGIASGFLFLIYCLGEWLR